MGRGVSRLRELRYSWLIALVAGILLGVLSIGAVWFARERADQTGRIVDAGAYDALASAGPGPPAFFARDDFYLVMTETGEPLAFYVYPPIAQVRERPDCAVTWQAQGLAPGSDGVLRDPCFGATFARDGGWISGPSSRGLDRFPVEVKDGRVLVDTRHLVCDGPGDCRRL